MSGAVYCVNCGAAGKLEDMMESYGVYICWVCVGTVSYCPHGRLTIQKCPLCGGKD